MIGVTKVIFGHFFPDSKMGMYNVHAILAFQNSPRSNYRSSYGNALRAEDVQKMSSKIAPHLRPAGGQPNLDFAAIRTDLTSAYLNRKEI